MIKKLFYGILVCLLFSSPGQSRENNKSAIFFIYPEMTLPIKKVFDNIIKGFADSVEGIEIKYIPINAQTETNIIVALLKRNNTTPIVALGDHAYSLTNIPSLQNRLIVGVVRQTPNKSKHSLVSLSMDVDVVKKKLRQILPQIKTIHYGDNGGKTFWFNNSSTLPHFKLKHINNNQTSIVQYLWETLKTADPNSEAIWINNNLEPYFLYKISEAAWDKSIILISNNLLHLGKGATLVFYTNYQNMGKRLGEIAVAKIKNNDLIVEGLQTINLGINIKFSEHSGISLPSDLNGTFQAIK